MATFHLLLNAILVIVILYALALILRWRGVLQEEHSLLLARLVIDVFLPATIFINLAGQKIHADQLAPSGVMLLVELIAIALAWAVSAALRFPPPQQGAIVFCSAFGSSALLGYPLIEAMFPGKAQAMTEAILTSELGNGYPIFILGPILGAYFGSQAGDLRQVWRASLSFFKSPIFFALIFGLGWSLLNLPGAENRFLAPIFQVCQLLAAAMTPIAILSVGLLLKKVDLRQILLPLAIVVLIEQIINPLLAGMIAIRLGFPAMWRDVLVLLAAMPPAALGVVFLKRYGADAALGSSLLLAATVLSAVTILVVYALIG